MESITKDKAKEIILNNRSKIFSVLFTKKDGTKRKMNARLDVKKDIKGVGLKYKPKEFNYIIAYDMLKKAYRTININTLEQLTLNKKEYHIKN